MPKDCFFQLFEPKRLKHINYLDAPPPPPPPRVSGSIPPWSIPPPPPGSGSVFSSLGLPVLDLVLRTFTCSTDSACSFETSVFSVNHLARIFAHAACRTQRCFKTASDASRCFHCHATMCVCVSHPTNLAGPLVVHKLPMNPLCHRPISCNNC